MTNAEDIKNDKRQVGNVATEDDLRYAYRLLLGREPDPDGWDYCRRAILQQGWPVDDLARAFIDSTEFRMRHAVDALGSGHVEILFAGYSLFVRADDRHIGEHMRGSNSYEPHVVAAMRDLLRPGYVLVDVGANVGFFTLMAAHLVGPQGIVVAVEPLDKNVQLIYRSMAKNGFQNVTVHACAASDRIELVTIETTNSTSNGQIRPYAKDTSWRLMVQTKRLDDLVVGLPRVDVLKLDIEGCELLAWRGFRDGLRKYRPAVLTEFHPHCMRTYLRIDPLEYLSEIFDYAAKVQVLSAEHDRIECATPADVMRQWELADRAANWKGLSHADLLILPR